MPNQIIHQTSCAVKSKGCKFPPNYFANHHNSNYFLYDFSECYLRNMAITEKVYPWNDWVRIISLSAKGKGWIWVIDSKFHQIGFGLAAHSSRIFKILLDSFTKTCYNVFINKLFYHNRLKMPSVRPVCAAVWRRFEWMKRGLSPRRSQWKKRGFTVITHFYSPSC